MVSAKAKGKKKAMISGLEEEEPLCLWPASGRVENCRLCYLPWGIQGSRRQDTVRRTESLLLNPLFRGMMFLTLTFRCRRTTKLSRTGLGKEATGFSSA